MALGRLTAGPPDFIGIGAQRCGTTWWFHLLVGHRGIRPPRRGIKELNFFRRFCNREMGDSDIREYYELFPRRKGQIVGEWTPNYMHEPWTAAPMRRAAPEARLLVMLRDPIDRFRSGVVHQREAWPDWSPERVAMDAIERGRYASQLRLFRTFFDAERILVLQYERCTRDFAGEFRRTLRFLGVAEDHEPRRVGRRWSYPTADRVDDLTPDLHASLRAAYEPEVRDLASLVPDLDLGLWPNFADLAR